LLVAPSDTPATPTGESAAPLPRARWPLILALCSIWSGLVITENISNHVLPLTLRRFASAMSASIGDTAAADASNPPTSLSMLRPDSCLHPPVSMGSTGAATSFETVLAEASERPGWRVHAHVVMRNHSHLTLETPQPKLVDGMHWLQSTFATRHRRASHPIPFNGDIVQAAVLTPCWLNKSCSRALSLHPPSHYSCSAP
jgi:hypothetical protein